ncbi:MAG: type II secretion system F family protein [Nocardioides sp.]|uniref:type II secretion system F family protein n=1 Tax=Nocardioides sp. TaxID=35761 RepID=UPI003EFC378C
MSLTARGLGLRAGAAACAAALAVLSVAGPASATDGVNIDHVQSDKGEGTLLLAVDGLPDGASPDLGSVEVEVDGEPVDATARTIEGGAGDVERASVLVVDASLSMNKDGKFDAARQAVGTYLATTPGDVQVGLVSFASGVHDALLPGPDREAISANLAALTLEKDTAVHDGIVAGVEALGTEGARSLVVLSDGADTSSEASLDDATKAAVDAGVVVDVVSLDPQERLTSLAEATGGQVIEADPASLESAFASQAAALSEQLSIDFSVPDDVPRGSQVRVTVTAGGEEYTDSALVALNGKKSKADLVDNTLSSFTSGKPLVSTPLMLAGAIALFLGLGGVLWISITGPGKAKGSALVDQYFSGGSTGGGRRAAGKAETPGLKDTAVSLASKAVNQDLETKISQRLTGAGSGLTASEWILVHAGIAVGAGLLGWLLKGAPLAVLFFVLGVIGPWVFLSLRHSRRLSAFNAQLAETLGLIAGGLQAGLSLPQAIDSVVQEGNEPMAGELRRALVEQRLGVDIADALDGVGDRMESQDFAWVVMAIRIQREVGGNLAEILHTVADTLREREYLRRQVRALSAEGRLSGYILTALPILVGIYMALVNPEYASLLWTTTAGVIMLAIAVALLGIGSLFMSKLAKVEI